MKNDNICNKCGKKLLVHKEIYYEDFIKVKKDWGYFSKKDGKTYSFILCETCADEFIDSFVIPAKVCDTTELV